jgi:subtilisin family serine protease
VIGHGTPCASIIGASPDTTPGMAQGTSLGTTPGTTLGIRGYAPDAELHPCKLPLDARLSDLVAALDYCLQGGIDLVCLGYGCERGSAIVDQRIAVAKQQGIGIIAAAGNTAGPVQFPACSPHVAAVGAIGEVGTFPEDSPQALQAETAAAYGSFVPPFSSHGPELDLCAPGLGVIACQAPDGYATARRSPPRMWRRWPR